MLVVAACIISLFTITYFDVLTPCLGLGPTSILWWPLTAVGVWILVNLVLNYTLAVITPPVRRTLPISSCGAHTKRSCCIAGCSR